VFFMREERWESEGWGQRGRGSEGRSGKGGGGRGRGHRGGPFGPGGTERPERPERSDHPDHPFGRHGGPFGPGASLEALFGRGAWGGRHGLGGRGSRARRGDVRAAILDLLSEGEALNGYQVIQTIAERTHGVWRPSAGSVYPALQQLEDEGLISPEGEGRSRLYQLTEQGQTYVTEHADELRTSWDAVAGMADEVVIELRDLIRQVAMATVEVARAGTNTQVNQARSVLSTTKKSLYRILAEDTTEDAEE
jgi:DNA-binding PadR family transcriptional regulator